MSAPLIGITSSHRKNKQGTEIVNLPEAYVAAVSHAGGVPLVISPSLPESSVNHLIDQLDGFLLSGGDDIHPGFYGGEMNSCIKNVDEQRDRLEIKIANAVMEAGIPFFGICRGCQILNVALGGRLYGDIKKQYPGAIKHDYFKNVPRDYLAHTIDVNEDSRLFKILGNTSCRVNSLHHQGIDLLAPGLHACAHAPDGLVEAVELTDHPFGIAVQWHPEWLQDNASMRNLFKEFIKAVVEVRDA